MEKFLNFNQPLFFILFLSFISKISSFLHFAYPTALNIKNKNICIVHLDGITICNKYYSEIIKNVTTFSKKLNKGNDLFRVSIEQFKDGYVACIIFNKIYIIDNTGELQLNETLTDDNNLYLTLALEKVIDKNYYYLIGYNKSTKQRSIFLNYYIYNSFSKINQKNITFEDFYIESYTIQYLMLTCQFLYNSNDNKSYIVCFYYSQYQYNFKEKCLSISSFYVNYTKIIHNKNYRFYCCDDIKYLKSTVSSDHLKALVGVYQEGNREARFIYYFNDYNIKTNTSINCQTYNYSTMELNYFQDKNEFVFSCKKYP